ncbi:hypothetical protein V7139_16410 [Neobacillus drentensis]
MEFLREILKSVMRELSAYVFRKNVLEHKKTTPHRSKQKGGSDKNNS